MAFRMKRDSNVTTVASSIVDDAKAYLANVRDFMRTNKKTGAFKAGSLLDRLGQVVNRHKKHRETLAILVALRELFETQEQFDSFRFNEADFNPSAKAQTVGFANASLKALQGVYQSITEREWKFELSMIDALMEIHGGTEQGCYVTEKSLEQMAKDVRKDIRSNAPIVITDQQNDALELLNLLYETWLLHEQNDFAALFSSEQGIETAATMAKSAMEVMDNQTTIIRGLTSELSENETSASASA